MITLCLRYAVLALTVGEEADNPILLSSMRILCDFWLSLRRKRTLTIKAHGIPNGNTFRTARHDGKGKYMA
jgi:hypothetical protein